MFSGYIRFFMLRNSLVERYENCWVSMIKMDWLVTQAQLNYVHH